MRSRSQGELRSEYLGRADALCPKQQNGEVVPKAIIRVGWTLVALTVSGLRLCELEDAACKGCCVAGQQRYIDRLRPTVGHIVVRLTAARHGHEPSSPSLDGTRLPASGCVVPKIGLKVFRIVGRRHTVDARGTMPWR
jgi:hypothetical protein